MSNWDAYTHKTMLAGSERLVSFSTELRDRLIGQGRELSFEDAHFIVRQMIGMANSLGMTIEAGKVRALLQKYQCKDDLKSPGAAPTVPVQRRLDSVKRPAQQNRL